MTHMFRSVVAAAGGLILAQNAFAHAKLVSATPPANGSATVPVRALELNFSEAVSAKLSGATIKPKAGGMLAAKASMEKGGKSLSLTPASPLKPGAYMVEWHAVASDDGHRTSGSYSFIVR